jgi:DDE family transposase
VREAIALLPEWAWTIADNHDGQRREGAQVADLTLVLAEATRLRRARAARERAAAGKPATKSAPASWPEGMRVIVRRERPHPGAQPDAYEERDGWRYQTFTTNTKAGQIAFLEARHRAHARVEDRIRQTQHAGLHRLPSRIFTINEAWLMLALTAADLLAWT